MESKERNLIFLPPEIPLEVYHADNMESTKQIETNITKI